MMLQEFHFLRPYWFLALIPALLLCLALLRHQQQSQNWLKFVAPNLLPYLLDRVQMQQRRWPLLGILGLWAITCFALAGPVWQKIAQPVERNMEALVICWDLSPSMLAEDIKPSRLVRSRLKLIDLLKSRTDGQVALIAYGGEAYTVTPLTDDRQTIINLLPALSPTTLPSFGSNAEMALTQAIQLLSDGGVTKGNILFLTDEITQNAMQSMASELKGTAHQLTLWGVGTESGAPIPLPEGGFAKDRQGDLIIARLNENQLRQFAVEQQAYYVPLLGSNSDIETLEQLLSPQATARKKTDRNFDQWFEHGQYLSLLLLPFIVLLFRKGLIFSLMLVVVLPFSVVPQAEAKTPSVWDHLWWNDDQLTERDLKQGDASAAQRFSTAERRGTASAHLGDYETAAKEFAQNNSAINAFNQGTSLTYAGQYKEAIQAFDDALKQDPEFQAAKHNRSIAEKLLALKEKQEQEASDDSQQNSRNENGENSDNQDNSNRADNSDQQNTSDSNEQQNQSDSAQSNSSSNESSQEQEISDAEAEKRAEQAQQSQENFSEENPYSQAADQRQKDQEGSANHEEERRAFAAEQHERETSEPMTEEEQMLEQWLRKVPDDPSGLLKTKFRHQYMERRQSLRNRTLKSDAEQRW